MAKGSRKKKEDFELSGEAPVEQKKPRKFTNKKGFEVERIEPDRFNIRKVKQSKKGAVTINYFERNDNGNWDQKTFTSAENPRPEFYRHLQSLAPEIEHICGFPKGYDEGMTVISASYDGIGADKVMTLALVAEKILGVDKTLKITTPAISAPYEEADENKCLSHGCVEKADHMWNECVRYLLGERSQMKLELDADERALVEEDTQPAKTRAKRSVSSETEKVFGMKPAADNVIPMAANS